MALFGALLQLLRPAFTGPGFELFSALVTGWVCAPGRRTITAMLGVGDPAGRRAHDAYHRLLRDGPWSMVWLWRALFLLAVARFCPQGPITLDVDDTLFRKSGRKVNGAGIFRDPVRSTSKAPAFAMGLNVVVVTLRLRAPWGLMPIALPVNARLHAKNDPLSPRALVRLTLVRDPDGVKPDDFFFSTDRAAHGAEIATRYAGRWAIEVCFRDTKQDLGGENPQYWKRQGPERAACLSLWLSSLVWSWYLQAHPDGKTWQSHPWYPRKATPSFLDALAAPRRALWAHRISAPSGLPPDANKITDVLLDTLAYAA